MKPKFPFPKSILPQESCMGEIDRIPNSFRNTPTLAIKGEDGKTVHELTKLRVKIKLRMRGPNGYIVALNDVRQTDKAGWVALLNGSTLPFPVNKCITKTGDILLWVFLPTRF